jgi:hypothetical protein
LLRGAKKVFLLFLAAWRRNPHSLSLERFDLRAHAPFSLGEQIMWSKDFLPIDNA